MLPRDCVDGNQLDIHVPEQPEQPVKTFLIGTLSDKMAEATVKPRDEVPIEGVDQRRAQFPFRDNFVRFAGQGDPNS